jgi:cytochrome c biogenesis protein CcdA
MSHHDELLRIIREVRGRWRWKVVLRSMTVLVGAAVFALLAVSYGLERFRFSPASIVVARVVTYVVLVALGWFFFVRPLGRRVSDQRVALYLEEHETSFQEALVSAVDVGAPDSPL